MWRTASRSSRVAGRRRLERHHRGRGSGGGATAGGPVQACGPLVLSASVELLSLRLSKSTLAPLACDTSRRRDGVARPRCLPARCRGRRRSSAPFRGRTSVFPPPQGVGPTFEPSRGCDGLNESPRKRLPGVVSRRRASGRCPSCRAPCPGTRPARRRRGLRRRRRTTIRPPRRERKDRCALGSERLGMVPLSAPAVPATAPRVARTRRSRARRAAASPPCPPGRAR
jgi:hypothetical protein